MKFTASLEELNQALQKVSQALPRRTTLPVLEHFYFILDGDNLKLIASDQSITIMNQIQVSSQEDGRVLVPGKRITDIIKALGDQEEISFVSNEENFEISIKTTFGKYTMKGLDPKDYLELPELFQSQKPELSRLVEPLSDDLKDSAALVSFKDLTWASDRTFFCVSKDDFKPAMTGVFFQFQGDRLNLVSTDSYRLAKATIFADNVNIFPKDKSVIVPARTVELLRKINEDALISFVNFEGDITHIRFDIGNLVVISRIIDEKYPKYESVIPSNNNLILKVNKKEIIPALKRVSIFASQLAKQVKLEIQTEKITLITQDEESGLQGQEIVPCQFNTDKFVIGFNYEFLLEAVENMQLLDDENDEIVITFSEPNRPALVKPNIDSDKLFMLLMPIRLSD